MVIHLSKYNKTEQMFLFIWTLYAVIYTFFSASELPYMVNLGNVTKYCAYLVLILQIITILLTYRFTKEQLIAVILLFLLTAIVEINITNKTFLIYIFFIVLAKSIQFDKLIKYDIKLKSILFITIILCCKLGLLNNYNYTVSGTEAVKQGMGFYHPNIFTGFALTILIEILYLYSLQMRLHGWIFIAIAYYAIYFIGGGRTTAYAFLLFYILFAIAKINPQIIRGKIGKFILTIITPVMAIVSFVMTYLYSEGNTWAIALDSILTKRLKFCAYFMEEYGMSLFGKDIETVSSRTAQLNHISSLILDNSYVRCGIVYGGVFLVLFCLIYSVFFNNAIKSNNVSLCLLSSYFVIIGFGESFTINAFYNVTLLAIANYIVSGGNKKIVKRIFTWEGYSN